MPRQSDRPSSFSSMPTWLVVVAMLAGGSLFWARQPLRSSRPSQTRQPELPTIWLQDVQARLWQDPLEAAYSHREAEETDRLSGYAHDADSLGKVIAGREMKGADVTVRPVMVSGGPYAEDVEQRLRSRHAVHAALGVAGYVPPPLRLHFGEYSIRTDPSSANDAWTAHWAGNTVIAAAGTPGYAIHVSINLSGKLVRREVAWADRSYGGE